jgi:glyoxylase-like metal-dependent hydrolase (beta-lactamase superfamily II)
LDAGSVACHVLIDGWRTVSPRFVFQGYDDAVQGEFVRPYLDAEGKLPGRVAALLVESLDGLVLVDAGNGRFAPELDVGHVYEELDALGVHPWDVRCVIITHGHADHVGGLVGPRGEPAFPDARHVIHRVEAEFWSSAEAEALPNGAGSPRRRRSRRSSTPSCSTPSKAAPTSPPGSRRSRLPVIRRGTSRCS